MKAMVFQLTKEPFPGSGRQGWPQLRVRVGRVLLLAFLIAALAPRAGFAQETSTKPVLNKYCPVLTGNLADPKITTVYKGRTIAFCCEECRAKFNADPEKYFGRLASLGTNNEQPPAGTHEKPAADTHGEGHEVQAASARDAGHDHPAGEKLAPFLGRVHPILVHFPVAGIPLAFLGLLVSLLRKTAFKAADVPPLLVAAVAAIAAVITGNIAHDTMHFGADLHEYIHWHQYAGTTVMILVLALSVLRIWRWNRLTGRWLWVYGSGLLLATLLVGLTGYLGGSIVFGPGHLAW